jgi:hypothetical protein
VLGGKSKREPRVSAFKLFSAFQLSIDILYWKGTKQQNASKNEFNRQFSKEVQVANKYIKKSSTSSPIKEMQIKTALKPCMVLHVYNPSTWDTVAQCGLLSNSLSQETKNYLRSMA